MIKKRNLKIGDYVLLKPSSYSWEFSGERKNTKNTVGKILKINHLYLRVEIISAENQERVREIKYNKIGWAYYKEDVIKVLSKLEVFGEIL